jgi:methyltransferase
MDVVLIVTAVIALQRLSELAVSKRHTAYAMARGGIEHGRGHYWLFVVLHAGWLIGWNVEWILGGRQLPDWWAWCAAIALLLQGLRYYVIRTLGVSWNTRIITWPDMPIADKGVFTLVKHPNYLVVALELAILPMMVNAWWTALIATILNAIILLGIRIPAEERALRDVRASQASRD